MVNVVQVTDDFQGNIGIQSEKLNHHILKFKSQVTFLSYRYSLFPVPELERMAVCQRDKWLYICYQNISHTNYLTACDFFVFGP